VTAQHSAEPELSRYRRFIEVAKSPRGQFVVTMSAIILLALVILLSIILYTNRTKGETDAANDRADRAVVGIEQLCQQVEQLGGVCAVDPATFRGDQGPAGPEGPAGPPGIPGQDGAQGAQGPEGPIGLKGDAGPVGEQGPEGPAGAQGPEGPAGAQGPVGPTGAAGTPGQTCSVNGGTLSWRTIKVEDETFEVLWCTRPIPEPTQQAR